jgi:hypothetical protein
MYGEIHLISMILYLSTAVGRLMDPKGEASSILILTIEVSGELHASLAFTHWHEPRYQLNNRKVSLRVERMNLKSFNDAKSTA